MAVNGRGRAAGFAAGQLVMFQQMGFGLGVAILIDPTLVRTVLMPAWMELLGDRNWYMPKFLDWRPDFRVEPPSAPAPKTGRPGLTSNPGTRALLPPGSRSFPRVSANGWCRVRLEHEAEDDADDDEAASCVGDDRYPYALEPRRPGRVGKQTGNSSCLLAALGEAFLKCVLRRAPGV